MINVKSFLKEILIVGILVATVLVLNYKAAQKAQAKSKVKTTEIHQTDIYQLKA